MDIRSQVFQLFGPKLIEAQHDFLLAQINHLRQEQGMPAITTDDMNTAMLNDAQHLPDYEWMDDNGT